MSFDVTTVSVGANPERFWRQNSGVRVPYRPRLEPLYVLAQE